MTKDETFSEGYLAGWQSVFGRGATLPGIPSHAIPAGKTEYQHGYDEGRSAAIARTKPDDRNSD